MSGGTTVAAVTVPADIARQLKRARAKHHRQALGLADTVLERDRIIVAAVEAGGSLREVGALAGLSQEAVRLIVNKAKGSTP